MFGDVIEDVHEEKAERELPGNEEDTQLYILFETNNPDLEVPVDDDDDEELTAVWIFHLGI